MDFIFFEKLRKEEANLYLDNFLYEAHEGLSQLVPQLNKDDVQVDYSIESIKHVIAWALKCINTIPENPDDNLPHWIVETEIYRKGLYSFDEYSKILVLRIAYYWGQCFILNFKKLSWGIGVQNTMEYNMPVVTGFKKRMEMAPIMICENLVRRMIEGKDNIIIDTAIESWISCI